MPDLAGMRRRRRAEVDDEEDDEAGLAMSSRGASPGSASKRPRLSRNDTTDSLTNGQAQVNGHATTNGEVDDGDEVESEPARGAGRDKRKHQPGAIVRVKLVNFVTYTAAEFFPGPSLNMVIGPNGTGKSTLVCAICLGLGWGSQHLGRAKEVSEFVKHGSTEAQIEIELARDPGRFKRNIVIGCTIKRDGNKSSFTINRKQAAKKQVIELCRSFAIQIDNLCQFLPQDKVVEFAAMTPVELLRSTQRAVASQEMIDAHEELKEFGKKQKELAAKMKAEEDSLANLEGRQRLQEADVQRMRERDEISKRVKMLELAKPTIEYNMAKAKYVEAKEKRKAAQQEMNALKEEVEPALRAVNAKQDYAQKIAGAIRTRKDNISGADRALNGIEQDSNELQSESKVIDGELEAMIADRKKQKEDALRLDRVIRETKAQIENAPADFDVAEYNERIRAKARESEQLKTQGEELKEQAMSMMNEAKEEKARLDGLERDLRQFDSAAGKQAIKLSKASRDTAKLWEYIQEHRDDFEKDVFGPPIVECSIKNPAHADQIESLFQRTLLLSCTVQTKKDFKLLSDIAHETLKLSEVNIKTMPGTLADFHAPMSTEELRHLGLNDWALNCISGPEPVLAMLCSDIRLHECGVNGSDITEEQFRALEQSVIGSWVTKNSVYRVLRRREYGPDAVTTQVRNVRPAQIFNDQVDTSGKSQLERDILELRDKIENFKADIGNARTEINAKGDAYDRVEHERQTISNEKASKQRALQEFKGLPTKLERDESKRESIQNATANLIKKRHERLNRQDRIAVERARLAVKYADAVKALLESHQALREAELMHIEATSDLSILEDRNREVRDLLESKKKIIEQLAQEAQEMRQLASSILQKVEKILAQPENDDLTEFIRDVVPGMTLENIDSEISSERARLELMHEGNSDIVREYENRKKKIEVVTSRVAEAKQLLSELDGAIVATRSTWEPQLDDLVGKISQSFSTNMEQISCAGEVTVHKDADFDEWAIQVRVKFRENEPLNLLTAHRQSGGERAVSTIFYLMSLQSLTPCPFRVVDEINQGMDPRNERLVHKRMVDIACGKETAEDHEEHLETGDDDGGSQYFLITPKLLPDLSYRRGMQVMCISSGEYMPEDPSRLDLRACVDKIRGMQAMDSLANGGAGRVIASSA